MCGGCGGGRVSDWTTAALGTTRSRTAAARAVHQLCHGAAIGVAVGVTPSGFTARWPTGRTAVTDTLVGLWSAIAQHHRLPKMNPPPPGPGAPVSPIRTPSATITLAVTPGHPPWNGTINRDHTTVVCADEVELDRVLHRLTTEPLRHRVRVIAITGVDWPELPAPQDSDPQQLPALLAWATGLQVGGHTRGHRLSVHCGTTSFAVVNGYGLGLVPGKPPDVVSRPVDGISSADRSPHRGGLSRAGSRDGRGVG